MECPNCGHELPYLAAVLAQTERGTQCPNCWTRLRKLEAPLLRMVAKKPERRVVPTRRAA